MPLNLTFSDLPAAPASGRMSSEAPPAGRVPSPPRPPAGAPWWKPWARDIANQPVRVARSPTQRREPGKDFIAARFAACEAMPGWWLSAARIRMEAASEAHAAGDHLRANRHMAISREYEGRAAGAGKP